MTHDPTTPPLDPERTVDALLSAWLLRGGLLPELVQPLLSAAIAIGIESDGAAAVATHLRRLADALEQPTR